MRISDWSSDVCSSDLSGWGEEVVGINDYEGEITGIPAPDSKFTELKIGMPMKQVTDLIGEPTDQGAYVTAKAFITFFFGGDKYRYEMAYKGQGRLGFSGKSMGTGGNQNGRGSGREGVCRNS